MNAPGHNPASRQASPTSRDHHPRKRGRTACTRCKSRKQKCDNEYPTCSNCLKAGVTCDKSTVRDDVDRQNDYTRALEERVAFLEQKLVQSGPPTGQAAPGDAVSLPSPQSGHTPSQGGTFGLDNNPVRDMVGLLALNSSEAPAYVGSSSGLSLAANLGEMVQNSVWNQFLSKTDNQASSELRNSSPQTTTGPLANASRTSHGSQSQNRLLRTDERPPKNVEPPSDDMGVKIIDTYFTRLHTRYPFLNRRQIWLLHEDRWRLARTPNEGLTRSDRFAIFKLNMVYAIGATLLEMSEKYAYTAPERFYATALQHVPTMCEARSTDNIEAMVLLVVYHLRTATSHGMWYMVGLAMRTAIDLGLHRKANETNMDPFLVQMRRRLFWTVYYLERVVSMSLGRQFSISDRHIDLDLPLDVDDDIQDPALLQAPQDEQKQTTLTYAIFLLQIRRIDSRIQHKIYRADRPLPALRPKMDSLYLELEKWKESAFLRFSGPELEYPTLHFNRAVRLLIQPFLPLLPITDPYYHICIRAAGDICQSHKRLHQTLEYGHSFLAVQTVFMAGITLLYALWTHTDQVWSVRMSNDIRACSTVLFVMGERAGWVKKYRDAFELLVNAAMEKLQGNEAARNAGMAELMSAQHAGVSAHNLDTGMLNGERFVPVNPSGMAQEPSLGSYPADETDHAVRMALQLAPWIEQDESDPLWMPDFQTLENLSGTFWSHPDATFFDAL